MKKFLVTTDLSPASHNATKYAVDLAEATGAEIILLSVTPLGFLIDDSMLASIMITQAEIMEKNKTMLKEEADLFSGSNSISIKSLAVEGDPANTIVNMINENNFDLIIMGTKGRGNSNSIFGSTTTTVINRVECPILVIPQNSSFEPIKNIALASDFDTATEYSTYKSIFLIADKFQSSISIINVKNKKEDLTQQQVIEKMNLNQLFSMFTHNFYTIDNENVEDAIIEFTENNPVHLLAMISIKHNFFFRLLGTEHTKKMSYRTKIPLLVVHAKS